ncbi:hypothetical protein P9135_27155, partial [Bacillus thuringiensis]|uniref:DUF3885 domain-containing protein n=1 Tax=Bacillus thuringiensis TaxID=1428 RepID=UPI002DC95C73|nr:hypothetical protein [Bacillus thuringiensis]
MVLKVGIEMRLNEYMLETFPNLELRPPLFYNWDIGIRFRLGVDYDCNNIYENSLYLEGVYKRTINLFQSLHSTKYDIYIVVYVNYHSNG